MFNPSVKLENAMIPWGQLNSTLRKRLSVLAVDEPCDDAGLYRQSGLRRANDV
jgi:hypothetical protein